MAIAKYLISYIFVSYLYILNFPLYFKKVFFFLRVFFLGDIINDVIFGIDFTFGAHCRYSLRIYQQANNY
jgi:hypothetical protein